MRRGRVHSLTLAELCRAGIHHALQLVAISRELVVRGETPSGIGAVLREFSYAVAEAVEGEPKNFDSTDYNLN